MNEQTAGERIGSLLGEQTLEAVVTAVGDLILVLDSEGTIQAAVGTEANPLGYPAEQLVGSSVATVVSTEIPAPLEFDITTGEELQTAVTQQDGETLTVPFERADGTVVPMSLSVLSREGTLVCVGQEITDRLHHPGLFDAVADPIYVLDARQRLQQVNDAMVEATGYDRETLLGREITEIIPADSEDAVPPEIVDADGQESTQRELTVVTADGELLEAEANVTVFTDEGGAYAGSVGVLRDISARKQHERNLERLKQVLTRVFRHNIRNELMVTKTHAEELAREIEPEHREHTTAILRSADRLLDHSEKARLIESVIESDQIREVDLSTVVGELVETARDRNPSASITIDLPAAMTVRAHPDIDRAIEELIGNAIEHAPDPAPTVDIWIDQQGAGTTLFIEDESGGLADEEIQVLRQGGENKLEHSSGVGLWLVRWLVEFSDAELIVHRTGTGTVVGIRFARRDNRLEADNSPLTRAPEQVRDVAPERFHGDTVVGRTEALNRLGEIYDRLERKGGHTVLVSGEAGIGKTTLIEQFQQRLCERAESPVVATGFCSETVQPPYHAFQQILRTLPGDEEVLHDLPSGSADDTVEPADGKEALFDEVARQLRAVAAEQPVLLIVEDMQWADSGTVALFEYLVDEVGRWSNPVLFLGSYRDSGVDETHPVLSVAEETAEAGRGTVLELEPLEEGAVETLLSRILGIEEIPSSFVTEFYDHTGGMPLFVQELGRHLADVVGPVTTPGDLPGNLSEIAVPETVERVITDRLEALPEHVQPVLRLGAVIGQEFSFDVLRAASTRPTDTLIDCIETLVDRHVWTRSGDELKFAHGIVREQTCSGIDDETRELLHERVTTAIETVRADRLDASAAQLGHHYEQMGAYGTAFDYYRRAGSFAADRFANEEAITQYERAITLAEDHGVSTDETVATVQLRLGETFEIVGQYDRAAECYGDSLERYRQIGDRDGEATCLDRLGTVARTLGEYDDARTHFERSIEIREELGDRTGEAAGLKNLGTIAYRKSDYGRAEEYYERSLAIFQEIDDRVGQAKSLHNLGIVTQRRGAYFRAKEIYTQSLELLQETGDPEIEWPCLNQLGVIESRVGSYDRSNEYFEQVLEIAREIGDQRGISNALSNLGQNAYIQGSNTLADEYFQEALTIQREIGDRNNESLSLYNLGLLKLREGEHDASRAYVEESLEIVEEIGDHRAKARGLCGLAMIAARENDLQEADRLARKALEGADTIGNNRIKIQSLRLLGTVARKRDEYNKAAEYLAESLSLGDPETDTHLRIRSHIEQGRVALARGDIGSARDAVARAAEITSKLDIPHQQAYLSQLRGQIAATADSPTEAIEHWQRALEGFEEVGVPHDALGTIRSLVETYGEREGSQEWIETATEIFETAPEPVREQHRDWLADHAAGIDRH